MKKIGVIATTQSMKDAADKTIVELGIANKVETRLATGNIGLGLSVAKELIAKEIEVIVTRGGIWELIRQSDLGVPVIEIPVGPSEFIAAIEEAKRLTGKNEPRIAIMAFCNTSYAMVFSRLTGLDVRIYETASADDSFESILSQAVNDGIEVMVGGKGSVDFAKRYGIPGVVLGTSDASMRSALLEAQKALNTRRMDLTRIRRTQMILDLLPDGVIDVDELGMIRLANPSAARLLDLDQSQGRQSVDAAMPFLDLSACLEHGESLADELHQHNNRSLVVSAWPIRAGEDVVGALVTLREANNIHKLEDKISSQSYAKGLIAVHSFADIEGKSQAVRAIAKKAALYAATNGTILITGETGTGKELFAQSIHNTSLCQQGPFVAVNCAALPPSLLESELFGYDAGAFTGAVRKGKQGFFELANNGTIFLDEISEMDRYGQTRLLRVLQEKRNMRLGGGRSIQLNIRVIAASNRNLQELVHKGEFRQDLYYRLTALTLHLPPLRERGDDVIHLAERFASDRLVEIGRKEYFTPEAIQYMLDYSWPGNVRELQNLVERLCLFYQGKPFNLTQVTRELEFNGWDTAKNNHPPAEVELSERETIVSILKETGGNQRLAAKRLKMHPSTLYRKMRHYGIRKEVQ